MNLVRSVPEVVFSGPVLATLSFGRCVGVSEVDWLGPLAEADEEEYDYADSCPAVVEAGEEFEVVVGEATVTCVVPAVPTDEVEWELLVEPSEGHSGLLDVLRYATYEVTLSEGEQFDPALLGWHRVVFGDQVVGLSPFSYAGDLERLLFLESEPKDQQLFNWVGGSFRQFDSFDELVEAAAG